MSYPSPLHTGQPEHHHAGYGHHDHAGYYLDECNIVRPARSLTKVQHPVESGSEQQDSVRTLETRGPGS